jgi:hypothetical protein
VAHGFIGTIIVIVMLIDSPPPCNHGRGFPPVIALFVKKIGFQQVMRLKTRSLLLPAPFWGPGRSPAAEQIYQRLQRRSFPWNQTDRRPAPLPPSLDFFARFFCSIFRIAFLDVSQQGEFKNAIKKERAKLSAAAKKK